MAVERFEFFFCRYKHSDLHLLPYLYHCNMSLFGYPDKKPTNRFCLNPTGKPSTSAKEKPVFIEYERPRAGQYRPFHHARLVVGAPGADKVLTLGS